MPFIILSFVLFLTIGFSTFYASMTVNNASAFVVPHADIRISGFSQSSVEGSGSSSGNHYTINNLYSTLVLGSSTSKVTYEVEVTNIGQVEMGILSITGLTNNIKMTTSSYNVGDKLCGANRCSNGAVATFYLTLEYEDPSLYNGSNNTFDLDLTVTFSEAFDITYTGLTSTTGLTTSILAGGSKNIGFDANTGIPSSVSVTGATSSYSSPVLSLSNPTGNVTVTCTISSGSGSGPPNGTVVTNNPDGSTTTISYDSNGDPSEEVTESTDNSGNVTTEEFTYVNGEPVKTGYNIDSTGSSDKIQTSNTGIDTGVIAFDGNDFVVTLEAEYTLSNFSQSKTNPIINISVSKDGVVNGILLTGLFNYGGSAYNESGTSISSSSTNQYLKFRFARYNGGTITGYDYYHKNGTNAFYTSRFVTRSTTFTFTIIIRYNSQSKTFSSEIYYG